MSITYDNNNGTGTASASTAAVGASVTLSNGSALTRAGYTLSRWDTSKDGDGTPYSLGQTGVTMPVGGLALFAVWTANTYTITYEANDATSGSVPSAGSFTTGGTAYVVASNDGLLARDGYTFGGWNTAADGKGTNYAVGASYFGFADLTLYAKWNAIPCADGGPCAVGDTGPGGGKVFYVHPSGTFACGPTLASTCRYLEAAPTTATSNAWIDSTAEWSGNTTTAIGATARREDIGTGYANTEAMVVQASGGGDANKAGTVTRAYRGPNNLSDWYLPSSNELNELCKYARQQTTGNTAASCNSAGSLRGGFLSAYYWSSTEVAAEWVCFQEFATGGGAKCNDNHEKFNQYRVRAIRAFK